MKSLFSQKEEFYKIELLIINLIVLFLLFRMAIPSFKYPFLFLYLIYTLFSISKYNRKIIRNFIDFLTAFSFPLLLLIIVVIQFLISNKLYLIVFKDIVNTSILLSCFFMFMLVIGTKERFGYFYNNLLKVIIVFALIISVFDFFVQFDILSFNDYAPKNPLATIPSTEPADIDNNFALLPVFFGMLCVLSHITKTESRLEKATAVILLSIFLLTIILSASRRGLMTLMVLTTFLIIVKSISFFNKSNKYRIIKEISSSGTYYFSALLFLAIITFLSLYLTDYNFKSKTLKSLGTRNVSAAFNRVTMNLFRYVQVINENTSYSDFYKRIWNPEFNPDEPDSGWGTRNHKTLGKLSGKDFEIVPEGSKGYLLDSTCDAVTREGNAYAYTLIWDDKINKKLVTGATVYCYVSEEFDGNYAMMALEAAGSDYKRVSYDLSKKGIWQKLSLEFSFSNIESPVYFYIAKFGVKDFSTLKGYVIFAHPQLETYSNIDSLNSFVSEKKNSKNLCLYQKILNNRIIPDSRTRHHQADTLIEKFRDNQYVKIQNGYNLDLNCTSSIVPAVFTRYLKNRISISNISETADTGRNFDSDPVRRWVSDFISEDTTYHSLKSVIFLDTITNNFINLRKVRWQFAWQIFTKEYTWPEKLIGGGFNFLNWYGYCFMKDKTASDWPHNPFLSISLYSGIIGLLIYIYFLYKVFYYYIKYLNEYPLLFVFFIITFFFSFFSGSSPFDPPIMGFFIILPFFIHQIHKGDASSTE